MKAAAQRSTRIASHVISGLMILLAFQNCSPVDFSGFDASGKSQITPNGDGNVDPDKNPDATPTPNPDPNATPTPTPTPAPTCTDANGTVRKDNETWTVVRFMDQDVPCPSAPSQTQRMQITDTLICTGGEIKVTGSVTTSVNEVPACPAPSLEVSVTPKVPVAGSTANLEIETAYVSTVAYGCFEVDTSKVVKQGQVPVGSAKVPVTVETDLKCNVQASNTAGVQITKQVDIPVDCGPKVKVGARCQEFTCKQFKPVVISSDGKLDVPARTADGICYAVKLFDRIANSPASLTTQRDTTVISRNHDVRANDSYDIHNPYLMGRKLVTFNLNGARQVKLAGSGDSLAPILVDNFVLVGIYPSSVANPGTQYFRAYGTSDSTVRDSSNILLNNQPVPVQAFATGATSTITPLDITAQVSPSMNYKLDVRALDCGSVRELSEIYLLFQ